MRSDQYDGRDRRRLTQATHRSPRAGEPATEDVFDTRHPNPRIASELAGWNRLRFEVTEDSSPGCDGVRHCYTPDLGIFTAVTVANLPWLW